MKKVVSIIIVLIIVLSLCLISVTAALPTIGMVGDINNDNQADVLDATIIQRYLANMEELDETQFIFADVDADWDVNIIDATNIQRYVARIRPCAKVGYAYSGDMLENDFYSDYESGMAMAGVPVTFSANVSSGSPIRSYDLYVDDVCVASSEKNSITYTFDKAGEYDVEIRINAVFNTGNIGQRRFKVLEPYESETPLFKTLYLTGKIQWGTITYDVNGMKVTADAIGGKAPYQYRFEFIRPEYFIENAGTVTVVQDYSENNVYELDVIKYSDLQYSGRFEDVETKLVVYIKDANGAVVSREMPIIYRGEVPVG